MYKVCVYEHADQDYLHKVDEFKFSRLLDLVDFLAEVDPLDFRYAISVDFVKDGD